MKKTLITLVFLSFTMPCFAVCNGEFINPITDVRWKCMFPISLGGISAQSIPFPEASSAIITDKTLSGAISPTCACADPIYRAGLTFALNNVFRIAEAVKDPLCFPSLGMEIGSGPWDMAGQDGGVKNTAQTTFNYTHLISFLPTQALNMFIDVLCLQISENPTFSILMLSEFEPWANSTEIALLMAPESILFAHPITQAYCMVDAVLTIFEYTDPIGYWCVGGHSIFPLSNHSVESTEYVDAASINVAKFLFKLTRMGQLNACLGSQALCSCFPTPIWNKREYRLQLAKPIVSKFCSRMGKSSLLWNIPNKNQALMKGADNLAFMIWRRRDCCVW